MSQKSSKRGRKHVHEDSDPDFKPPLSLKHASIEQEDSASMTENGNKSETNGDPQIEHERVKTRSRSNTPLKKKKMEMYEYEDNQEETKTNGENSNEVSPENGNEMKEEIIMEMLDIGEMDPLILADEADPELVFEENSDSESPVLGRCHTRRSQSKTIPTPQTPKSDASAPIDEPTVANEESIMSENVSTNVEVGGDSTRLDFTEADDNSFLNQSKNKSMAETLRGLSSRRTIRPISCDYRKQALMRGSNADKSELNATYPLRNSVEFVSVGVKRKNSWSEAVDGKRFKEEGSSGWMARILSPFSKMRNRFRSDTSEPNSPKLTVYKDDNFLVEKKTIIDAGAAESKWCTIM